MAIHDGKRLKDDPELHESYGQEIKQPSMTKGTYVAFGELAGSGDITPRRHITFDDSVDDNKRNQPKSH